MRVFSFLLVFCICRSVLADWQSVDIPDDGSLLVGSAMEDAGTWTIEASGADIWGTSDQCHFLYDDDGEPATDYAMSCLVESLTQPTNNWAKAGLMVRAGTPGTNQSESYAFLFCSTGNGINFQYRDGAGTNAANAAGGLRWHEPPDHVNLKLVRSGSLYAGYASVDGGQNWRLIGEHDFQSLAGAEDAYRGFTLTSHDTAVLATAVVSDVNLDAEPLSGNAPANFACLAEGDTVELTWTNTVAYDAITLTRTDVASGDAEVISVPPANDFYDDAPESGIYEYALSAVDDGLQTTASTCLVKIGTRGTIDPDGYFQTWLLLGPLAQGGGDTPGQSMYEDYLATQDGITEANVLPEGGDEMAIDFGLAASTAVQGPTANGRNPEALSGTAVWYAWEDSDFRIDHNDVYGADYNEMLVYHVCYLTNTTPDALLLEAVAASDNTCVYMLDNSVMGITYWGGWAEASFPFLVPPGDHRVMLKCFEGGGGNGIQFRLRDPATGQTIASDDARLEYAISRPAGLTEMPEAATATATRTLPALFVGEEATVTITVTGGPLTIMEMIPAGVEVVDLNGGTLTGGIVTWTDVTGSLTYGVEPSDGHVSFLGVAYQANGAPLPIGGMATSIVPERMAGWQTADIADSGAAGTGAAITPSGDAFDMEIIGSGHDIWDRADDFRFVWREFPVDGMVILQARLESFPRTTNDWAKAGIMFRQNLTQGSPYVIGGVDVGNLDPDTQEVGDPGRFCQFRDVQDDPARSDTGHPSQVLPYWIRVIYDAGLVSVFFADDFGGIPEVDDWQLFDAQNLTLMAGVDMVYGGLAVSSHDDNGLVTATFTDVQSVEVCKPAIVTRALDWEARINAEGAMAAVIADDGTDILPVALTITGVRADGGDCPDLGDVTIIETLPDDWTAENVSHGGVHDGVFNTITWRFNDGNLPEGELTYGLAGQFTASKALTISGTIQEDGNAFIFDIMGDAMAVSDATIGMDGAILKWLILGPFTHNSPAGDHDSAIMALDHLDDGEAVTEASISTVEALFQEAGDEVTPDYGGAAASTGLNPAANAGLNPNHSSGAAQWTAFMDIDGARVDLTNQGLYGTNNNCMNYGLCYLTLEEDTPIIFACGSDDAIQILLDGNEVWNNPADRGWPGFVDIPPVVNVAAGDHVLLVKIFNGNGGWNFGVQLGDEFGVPLTAGVSVSLTPPVGGDGIAVSVGDINLDGRSNLADAITLLSYLFVDKSGIDCLKGADANDDGKLDLGDAITILSYQFTGGTLTAPDGSLLGSSAAGGEKPVGCYVYPEADVADLGCETPCTE